MLDVAESKNELLARIDTFEQDESVCRMIDLAILRRQPPERPREEMRGGDNPTPVTIMVVVLHTLAAAEYIERHSDQASTARGRD